MFPRLKLTSRIASPTYIWPVRSANTHTHTQCHIISHKLHWDIPYHAVLSYFSVSDSKYKGLNRSKVDTGLVFEYSRDEYRQIVLRPTLDTQSQTTRLVTLYTHMPHLQFITSALEPLEQDWWLVLAGTATVTDSYLRRLINARH